MLLVAKDTVVTLTYDLTDSDGESIEAGATLAYLHGGYDGIFPKVEEGLGISKLVCSSRGFRQAKTMIVGSSTPSPTLQTDKRLSTAITRWQVSVSSSNVSSLKCALRQVKKLRTAIRTARMVFTTRIGSVPRGSKTAGRNLKRLLPVIHVHADANPVDTRRAVSFDTRNVFDDPLV